MVGAHSVHVIKVRIACVMVGLGYPPTWEVSTVMGVPKKMDGKNGWFMRETPSEMEDDWG